MEGKTFGDELKRIGWVGDEQVGARKMHAYFEYHIEQGPISRPKRSRSVWSPTVRACGGWNSH